MNEKQRMEFQQKIIFGIGDLAKMTGVSARQLRYWEEKGYIEASVSEDCKVRKYSLRTYFTVAAIKSYLDEGYTLSKSVEKAQLSRAQIIIWNKFTLGAKSVIEVNDIEQEYGRINFGELKVPGHKQPLCLYGIVDQNGSHIEISEER
jgi:hypothetical protein